MKRLLLLTLLTSALQAQTGDAAAKNATATQSGEWKNWTFVATAMVTAAAGIIVVAVNDGHSAH